MDTSQAIEVQSTNFKASKLFSESEFLELLQPHRSSKVEYDKHLVPRVAIYPLIEINPSINTRKCSLDHSFGFVFLPTLTNTVYALLTRVLMPLDIKTPDLIPHCFDFFESLPACPLKDGYVDEYLKTLKPHNRKRLLLAFKRLQESYVLPRKIDLFVKSDELLIDKMKPRVIWNVHPTFQVLLGPHVLRMTAWFCKLFDGVWIFCYGGLKFTLKFACGMIAEDLDAWRDHSEMLLRSGAIDFAGIFLGDDSLVLKLEGDVLIGIENDFEKFDRSQETGAFKYVQGIYKHNLVPNHHLKARHAMFHCGIRVRYGREREFKFSVRLKKPQQATGQPGTCLDNTLLNISSTIHVQTGGSYSDFGFLAKTKVGPMESCTFLRGFWCRGIDNKLHWNYLPSVSIKLLKSLVDPTKLFPFSFDPMKAVANAMFSSVGLCASPIIRVGVQRFATGASSITKEQRIQRKTMDDLDESALFNFLVNRYGREGAALILDLESQFQAVPLGGELSHPAWQVLARDYA